MTTSNPNGKAWAACLLAAIASTAQVSRSHAQAIAPPPLPAPAASTPVAAVPIVQRWAKFIDPQEVAFSADVPQNWKTQGGTFRRNALQFRNWVASVSPDGNTVIALNDPREESYIAPSPLLSYAGFQIGSLYNASGTIYRVEPAQTGQQYAAYWGQSRLASSCSNVRVVGARARSDLGQQSSQQLAAFGIRRDVGEAVFSCRRNNMDMTAYAIVGVTYLGPTGVWYADSIAAFVAPSRVAGIAAGVFAHMIGSVQVNPQWLAKVSENAAEISRAATWSNAAISDDIMKGWAERGAVMDKIMDEGSRARLGIDFYNDPATGDKYTVGSQHHFYWVNPSGTVIGTDTDSAPIGFRRMSRLPPAVN